MNPHAELIILQNFAECFAQSIGLEITIADINYVRIAGTGAFKNKIHEPLPVGSVYRNAAAFSKPILVNEARGDEYCGLCENRERCLVKAEACAPITLGETVWGVVGLVAMDDAQRRHFLKKRSDYTNTVMKLAELTRILFEITGIRDGLKIPVVRYPSDTVAFDMILHESKEMRDVITIAKKAAQIDTGLLITGESGTGKELFARAIHYSSPRKDHVFEAINCSAIPDNLLESELFGYEEGAFTGATKRGKIGRFQIAHKGTIFLDEIGDMAPNLQAKLLRFLEDKRIDRVGGIGPVQVDTRIIAATNKNLRDLVKQGKFREDLYYRLNVIPIFIKPLRERVDDIDLLADFYLRQCNMRYKKNIVSIEDKLLARFHEYEWPGNIRELKNLIEYGVFLEDSSSLREKTVSSKFEIDEDVDSKYRTPNGKLSQMIRNIESKIIRETLDRYKGHPSCVDKAARSLGISRASLYRKLGLSNKQELSHQ